MLKVHNRFENRTRVFNLGKTLGVTEKQEESFSSRSRTPPLQLPRSAEMEVMMATIWKDVQFKKLSFAVSLSSNENEKETRKWRATCLQSGLETSYELIIEIDVNTPVTFILIILQVTLRTWRRDPEF